MRKDAFQDIGECDPDKKKPDLPSVRLPTPFRDSRGPAIPQTVPVGRITAFSLDRKGKLIAKTDAAGRTITYLYDSRGRLVRKDYPDGSTETFRYDAGGSLAFAANKAIAYEFRYNAEGRITEAIDSNGREITYRYDSGGRRKGMLTPGGRRVTYGYDGQGRLCRIITETGVFRWEYDDNGCREKLSMPNGCSVIHQYDENGRWTGLRHETAGGRCIGGWTYGYNAAGKLVSIEGTDGAIQYSYDSAGRLLRVLSFPLRGQGASRGEQYSYDQAGNRLSGPGKGDYFAYTRAHQLVVDRNYSYSFDKKGNLAEKKGVPGARAIRHAYEYDDENRLVKATIEEERGRKIVLFAYDPLGRRISKTVREEAADEREGAEECGNADGKEETTTFVYDNEEIFSEVHPRGEGTTYYLHGMKIDEPLSMERDGEIYFYHADALGSIIALTGPKGDVVQTYSYDSFGRVRGKTGSIRQPYAFTGREWDEEIGMYYYRNRYYDPMAGRFTTRDPIEVGLNPYVYVSNNPVNYIDPLGL